MAVKRVQAIVSGRVKGVGFRYFATHTAEQLGVVGTVRNLHEDQVEAIAEGDETALNKFLAELRRGPHNSEVTGLETAWGEPVGAYTTFEAVA